MVNTTNPIAIKNYADQTGSRELLNSVNVQPIINITPNVINQDPFTTYKILSVTGGTTAITTSTIKRTFLTHISFTFSKNAACDLPSASILGFELTDKNDKKIIYAVSNITLTHERDSISINFSEPFELKKGTAIYINSVSFGAGELVRTLNAIGYEQ